MNLILKFSVFMFYSCSLFFIQARRHEDISKCFLTRVHTMRQTIIESPNYPNNYKADICWDYVIRSPFQCPTKFHVQFLQFDLEFSEGCKNDYLAIGLQNTNNDMDVMCGQVVGIKKYHTPDGILRLRFFADDSPWTTGKGFKLLITRLACEREELLRKLNDEYDDDDTKDDDSIAVTAPPEFFQPPESELIQIFRNLTGRDQFQRIPLYPVYGLNNPTQLYSPPYSAAGTDFLSASGNHRPLSFFTGNNEENISTWHCPTDNEQQRQLTDLPGNYGALKGHQPNYIPLNRFNELQLPQNANTGGFALTTRDQYVDSWSNTPSLWRTYNNAIHTLEACCVSSFQQKRFYLSSPGFPHTIFSNISPNLPKRDCVFRLQKFASNVCRLRLDLKFFDFGQKNQGIGSFRSNIGQPTVHNTHDACQADFIEIDNQRFCGCRSGFTFTAYWPSAAEKRLRMHMGYSSIPSRGFLLELMQEECSESELASMSATRPIDSGLSTLELNPINNPLASPQQELQTLLGLQNKYGGIFPTQQQQQYNQQQMQLQSNLPNLLIRQQIFNTAAGLPTYLQPPNQLLTQQQKQPQFSQNNYPYPSSFTSNYFTSPDLQQNFPQSTDFNTNPFSWSQIKYARSYSDQQPTTVVETNSTRKEYYYAENEDPHDDEPISYLTRSSSIGKQLNWDRKDTKINENISSFSNYGRERNKCTFDMGDTLRLSTDILWITRPICYAPERNRFTNWIG